MLNYILGIVSKIEKAVDLVSPLFRFFILTIVLFSIWALLFYFPVKKYEGNSTLSYPSCPMHHFTGFYCPGCGSTRTISELSHLNFLVAWKYNKLLILFLPYLIYRYLCYGAICFGIWERKKPESPFFIWFIFVVIMVYWVLRNIPLYPFTLLAPAS